MILIGENIHIISKNVRNALEQKDENFVKILLKIMQNCDAIDFNVGPAKGKLDKIFEWLYPLTFEFYSGQKLPVISFDTSNIQAIEDGLKLVQNQSECYINSTSADDEKLERLTDLTCEFGCNLIALSMSKEIGVPKTTDMRMELIFKIYEKCMEKGIDSHKIYFDPLILPVNIEQSQALEVINTIQTVKESFDPKVNTVVGLSNISNGLPVNLRALVNRVFGVLLFGAGLDAAIADAKDEELFRVFKMLECNNPQNDIDKLYINLSNMVQCFGDICDVEYDKDDMQQANIIKIARILMNKEVYSDSFAQI